MKTRLVKGVWHKCYENEEEFRTEHDEPLKDWRVGEEGDWVVTDDGQVVQVLKTGSLYTKSYVRTIIGQFGVAHGAMEGEFAGTIYDFNGGAKTVLWPVDKLFCAFFVDGLSPEQAYIASRPGCKTKNAKRYASRLLKHKLIRDRIMEEARKRMGDYIEPKDLVKIMLDGARVAAKEGNIKDLGPFIVMLAKIAGENIEGDQKLLPVRSSIPVIRDAETE